MADLEAPLFSIEGGRCANCKREEFFINGPDGVDIGSTFWDEESAEYHLEILLKGAAAERARIRERLLNFLSEHSFRHAQLGEVLPGDFYRKMVDRICPPEGA